MFQQKISNDLKLRILEEKDAEELFTLTDENRKHLCKWLPWLDKTLTVDDTEG